MSVVGELGGESSVSGDGVGFMSVSVVAVAVVVERLDFEEDVALFDGCFGFISILDDSGVVVRFAQRCLVYRGVIFFF